MYSKEPEDSVSCSHNQACHWWRSKTDKSILIPRSQSVSDTSKHYPSVKPEALSALRKKEVFHEDQKQ